MAIWKDAQDNLYDDMAGDALSLPHWPQGLTNITDSEADAIRAAAIAHLIPKRVRAERDACIEAVAWRYERHARELRLGLPPTDDLAGLDAFVQALADLPNRAGFPSSAEFDAYVAALYDLPNQPGFPSITLPVAP